MNKKDDAGDIDAIILSQNILSLSEILPKGHIVIRPKSFENINSNRFLAEIKRSLSCDNNGKGKINTFVDFYFQLFKEDGDISVSSIGSKTRNDVNDKNSILIFLFNGEDPSKVENDMTNKTGAKDFAICSRKVACIWCFSSKLIEWESLIKNEEKDEIIAALCFEINELKAKLAYKSSKKNGNSVSI